MAVLHEVIPLSQALEFSAAQELVANIKAVDALRLPVLRPAVEEPPTDDEMVRMLEALYAAQGVELPPELIEAGVASGRMPPKMRTDSWFPRLLSLMWARRDHLRWCLGGLVLFLVTCVGGIYLAVAAINDVARRDASAALTQADTAIRDFRARLNEAGEVQTQLEKAIAAARSVASDPLERQLAKLARRAGNVRRGISHLIILANDLGPERAAIVTPAQAVAVQAAADRASAQGRMLKGIVTSQRALAALTQRSVQTNARIEDLQSMVAASQDLNDDSIGFELDHALEMLAIGELDEAQAAFVHAQGQYEVAIRLVVVKTQAQSLIAELTTGSRDESTRAMVAELQADIDNANPSDVRTTELALAQLQAATRALDPVAYLRVALSPAAPHGVSAIVRAGTIRYCLHAKAVDASGMAITIAMGNGASGRAWASRGCVRVSRQEFEERSRRAPLDGELIGSKLSGTLVLAIDPQIAIEGAAAVEAEA